MEFVYKGQIYTTAPKEGQGTDAHNRIYRGLALGTFTSTYDQAVQDGTFDNMYIGDTFTMGGHNYTIAGFNYEFGKDHNKDLGNHVMLLTDPMLNGKPMASADVTNTGFAGTDMFKTYLPTVTAQLQRDWGSHLLTFSEYLSTSTDGSGHINNATWYNVQCMLPNAWMYWNSADVDKGFEGNNTYNQGIDNSIMPLMLLHPDAKKDPNHWLWLRDVYNSRSFAGVYYDGTADWDNASAGSGGGAVRAFFLIA